MLDVTCCVRLRCCVLLGVFVQRLKPVKLSLAMCKRTQQLPTMVRVRFHGAFKNGSLLFSSLHVNEFGVGEQVVNWQTTSAWCLLR